MCLEPFLVAANVCAENSHRRAYVHMVGLGLGVWSVDSKVQVNSSSSSSSSSFFSSLETVQVKDVFYLGKGIICLFKYLTIYFLIYQFTTLSLNRHIYLQSMMKSLILSTSYIDVGRYTYTSIYM